MKNNGLIILLCFFALAIPASGTTVTIGNYTVTHDGSVVAQMIANNVTNLGSVTVNLTFNPAVVHVTSVDVGTGNALTWAFDSNLDNFTGSAVVVTGDQYGLSGDVIIANFAMNAVGIEGISSPLNIDINSFADASSNEIPVTPINGSFNIKGSGTSGTNGGGGSGGGGGGGGGGRSGENTSNIEVIEKYDMQISKDVLTSYRFIHAKNPIMFVNITGNTNLGIITSSVEVLKDTSTLVKVSPEGLVYKNANIWVGTSGFATPKNIKDALIKFRITNDWMSTNGVQATDIVLVKWDGTSWIDLETKVLSKDETNTYFEGRTNAFSPFAIVAKTAAGPTVTTPTPVGTPKITATATATPVPTKKTPGFGIVLALAGLMAVVLRKRGW